MIIHDYDDDDSSFQIYDYWLGNNNVKSLYSDDGSWVIDPYLLVLLKKKIMLKNVLQSQEYEEHNQ